MGATSREDAERRRRQVRKGGVMESEGLVRIEELPGKGRGVVSSKPLKAGEIVVRDSPILLYSASPLSPTPLHPYCDFCFRKQPPSFSSSSSSSSSSCCSLHRFCSHHCRSSSSHSPWLCHSLSLLSHPSSPIHHQSHQLHVQARFLLSAYNLAIVSPSQFRLLLSLLSLPHYDSEAALFLHSLLPPPPPLDGLAFSVDLTASLLSQDRLNAFGLMEPFDQSKAGERSVRAYGIYPKASFFNHDCLPNACRFDYVDSAASNNTDIIIRMIHDVPQGREICLSYFPVNLNYSSRQKTLLNDYGFTCDCDRCKVEANWSEHEDDEGDNAAEEEEEEEAMEEEEEEDESMDDENVATNSSENEEFPHAYFFMRYMCDRPNCWGTLAPLPTSSVLLECNVCGHIKHDQLSGLC